METADWLSIAVLVQTVAIIVLVAVVAYERIHMSARSDALDASLSALTIAVNTALPLIGQCDPADGASMDNATQAMKDMQNAIVAKLPPGTVPTP